MCKFVKNTGGIPFVFRFMNYWPCRHVHDKIPINLIGGQLTRFAHAWIQTSVKDHLQLRKKDELDVAYCTVLSYNSEI